MATHRAMALSLLLASCLVAGVLGGPTYPPPYPPPPYGTSGGARGPYPPNPAPPSPPMPPLPPGAATNLTGFARFLGPLSAGCNVVYDYGNGTTIQAAATTLGSVSVGSYQSVRVVPGTGCTDSFTGVAIPFSAGGKSPASTSFQVSATNTIGLASTQLGQPASFSYIKLGAMGVASLESSDVFAVLRSGNSTAWTVLSYDLQWILVADTLAAAYVANNPSSTACNTLPLAHQALATWIATKADYNLLSTSTVSQMVEGMVSVCNTTANVTAITNAASPIISALQGWLPVLEAQPQAYTLARFARFASLISTTSLSDLTTLTANLTNLRTALTNALEAAPIQPDNIAVALGLAAKPAQATTVEPILTGPLSGAVMTFTPWHSGRNTSIPNSVGSADQTSATTTNANGTFGMYTVAAGATDLFLTGDPSNPVTTLIPFKALVGFTGSSGVVSVAPIGALAGAAWFYAQTIRTNNTVNDLPVPTAVSSVDYYNAYTNILGTGVLDPNADYIARTYAAGSASQAGAMIADAVVGGTAGLVASFVANTLANQTGARDINFIADQVFYNLINKTATDYTNTSFIGNLTRSVYFSAGGKPPAPSYGSYGGYGGYGSAAPAPAPAPSGNYGGSGASTATPEFDEIIYNIATSITESNKLILNYVSAVAGGSFAGRRLLQQNSNAFVGTSQVSAVQNQDMSSSSKGVSSKTASGDTAGALAAARQMASDFSGANLLSKVNAKAVNTAAINAGTSLPSDGNNKKKIALGVGLGVGLGVPVMAALVAGVVMYVKSRRAEQTTAPAAAAEGVYRAVETSISVGAVPAETSEQERMAQYFRNRVAAAGYSGRT